LNGIAVLDGHAGMFRREMPQLRAAACAPRTGAWRGLRIVVSWATGGRQDLLESSVQVIVLERAGFAEFVELQGQRQAALAN
jgi:hypothetical protein